MKFGRLEIDPALSPGVLDTATWDTAAAWTAVQAAEKTSLRTIDLPKIR